MKSFWKKQKNWVLWPVMRQTSRSKVMTAMSSVSKALKPFSRSPFFFISNPAVKKSRFFFLRLVGQADFAFCCVPSGHTKSKSSGRSEIRAFWGFSSWSPQIVPTFGTAQKEQKIWIISEQIQKKFLKSTIRNRSFRKIKSDWLSIPYESQSHIWISSHLPSNSILCCSPFCSEVRFSKKSFWRQE